MTPQEMEYRLLYSMVVAGKSATFAENALKRFLGGDPEPFAFIRELEEAGELRNRLIFSRTGNYQKLTKGFTLLANAELDLATCTTEQLESIHGIGPKTSRFFILWTRPDAKHAALDTHVLKWLRFIGHAAPPATPSGEKYTKLEKIILAEADARGVTARELDAAIWDWCSTGHHLNGTWPDNLQRLVPVTP